MTHQLSAQNRSFHSLLDACADAEELTIFVGAGCSAEAGVPTWDVMLSRLIRLSLSVDSGMRLMHEVGVEAAADAYEQVHRAAKGDPARLATLAELLTGQRNHFSVLRLALYGDIDRFEPGPTTTQIAQLYRDRLTDRKITHLVTTNYDELLLNAIREANTSKRVAVVRSLEHLSTDGGGRADGGVGFLIGERDGLEGASSISPISDDDLGSRLAIADAHSVDSEFVVLDHLHGMMAYSQDLVVEPIVLSERSYARYSYLSATAIANRMSRSTCLFVGLSLSDIDLIHAAYQVSDEVDPGQRPHFALVTEDGSIPPMTRRISAMRLERMGIQLLEPIRAYSQIPQVLYELRMRTKLGQAYWEDAGQRYGARLQGWNEELLRRYPSTDYHSTQDGLSAQLRTALQAILSKEQLKGADENLGIHLWLRCHETLELFLWATTEYSGRNAEHFKYLSPIQLGSGFTAVDQAFFGTAMPRFAPISNSRWKQVLAVPIVTSEMEHRWGRLLVGVLTLSSDSDILESQMFRALSTRPDRYIDLVELLRSCGKRILVDLDDPDAVDGSG